MATHPTQNRSDDHTEPGSESIATAWRLFAVLAVTLVPGILFALRVPVGPAVGALIVVIVAGAILLANRVTSGSSTPFWIVVDSAILLGSLGLVAAKPWTMAIAAGAVLLTGTDVLMTWLSRRAEDKNSIGDSSMVADAFSRQQQKHASLMREFDAEAVPDREREADFSSESDTSTGRIVQRWIRLESESEDLLEGEVVVTFACGETFKTVHIPVWPTFEETPRVDCFVTDSDRVRVRVAERSAWGIRLELRQSRSLATVQATIAVQIMHEKSSCKAA